MQSVKTLVLPLRYFLLLGSSFTLYLNEYVYSFSLGSLMSKKAARSMSALLSNSSHLNCLLIFTLCTLLIGNALILLVNGQCPDVSVTIAGEEHEQRTYQIDENLYDDEEGKMWNTLMLSK